MERTIGAIKESAGLGQIKRERNGRGRHACHCKRKLNLHHSNVIKERAEKTRKSAGGPKNHPKATEGVENGGARRSPIKMKEKSKKKRKRVSRRRKVKRAGGPEKGF